MTVSVPEVRVLVVDDEKNLLDDYRYILGDTQRSDTAASLDALEVDLFGRAMARALPNVELETFQQGEEAVAAVAAATREGRPFAVAFIDLRMPPGLHGVETAEKIRSIDPDVQIVIVTAYADVHPFEIAGQVPPTDRLFFIQKPFNALEIQQFVNALSAKWRAERLIRQLRTVPERASDRRAATRDHTDALPVGVAIFDREDRLVSINDSLRALYRDAPLALEPGTTYEACLREISRSALDPQRLARPDSWVADRLLWHRGATGPLEHRLRNGVVVATIERRLSDGSCVAVHVDVSELVARQEARTASERDAAVHAAIGSCAELLNVSFGKVVAALHAAVPRTDGDAQAAYATGLDAATRMRQDLERLEEIGLRRRKNAAVVDLGRVVPKLQQELATIVGKQVSVEVVVEPGVWPTALDSARLREALAELAANARQAMPTGGRLKVTVENVPGSPSGDGLTARDHIVIAVADTGIGMNAEVRSRALRPFFTTRRAQGLSGLGLSAARSFIIQSFGEVEIDSREGAGTTVRLLLPRWSKESTGESSDGPIA